MKKYRIISIMITVVFLFTVFFAGLFILEHTHHHCTGEDCPVCMELEMSMHTVSALRTLLPVIIVLLSIMCFIKVFANNITKLYFAKLTLINLKVELDD